MEATCNTDGRNNKYVQINGGGDASGTYNQNETKKRTKKNETIHENKKAKKERVKERKVWPEGVQFQ
jgi:hypothetical protein